MHCKIPLFRIGCGRVACLVAVALGLSVVLTSSGARGQDTTPGNDLGDLFEGLDAPAEQPEQTMEPAVEGETPEGPTAEEVWQEAQQLAEEGRCAEAIERYSMLVRYNIIPAMFERAKCFVELKEYDLAIQSFSQAWREMRGAPVSQLGVQIFPHEVLLELAKLKLELPEPRIPEALDDLNTAIELKPTVAELFYQRGVALSKQATRLSREDFVATYEAAIESFDRALDLQSDYADAYFERGLAKVQLAAATGEQDQVDEGIKDLGKARQLDPENLQYDAQTGLAYISRAKQEASRHADEKMAEIVADFQAALGLLDSFIEKHPETPSASSESDSASVPLGSDTQNGEDEEEEDPEDVTIEQALLARADTKISLAKHLPSGDRPALYQAAIDDCNLAIQVEEDSFVAYYNRGLAWRLLGDYRQALDDFTKALEINSGLYEARLRRGIVWFYLGDYDIALGDFSRAMLGRADGRAKFWAGVASSQLGDFAEAVEYYSDALRENPGYQLAYNNRGLVYLRLGEYRRAADDFNELIRRDRENARAYYRRGLAYQALGKPDEAQQSFQRAAELENEAPASQTTP